MDLFPAVAPKYALIEIEVNEYKPPSVSSNIAPSIELADQYVEPGEFLTYSVKGYDFEGDSFYVSGVSLGAVMFYSTYSIALDGTVTFDFEPAAD